MPGAALLSLSIFNQGPAGPTGSLINMVTKGNVATSATEATRTQGMMREVDVRTAKPSSKFRDQSKKG